MVKQNAFRVIVVMAIFAALCWLHHEGHYLAAAWGEFPLCALAAYLWRRRDHDDSTARACGAWSVCLMAVGLTYAFGMTWIYRPIMPYPEHIPTLSFSGLQGLGLLIGIMVANATGLIGFKPAPAPSRA